MTAIDASLPKKERILIAAEDVFSRRGYTKATLDEIIALADTGKGTLYKYFGNKDNLFYTLIEEKHSHLMDELHSLTAQQPDIRGKLQAYLNCMLKFLRTNKGLWLIVWYELNAAHQGIHPDFDENGNWILTSLYGDPLSRPEEERLLRYYKIFVGGSLRTGSNFAGRAGKRLLKIHPFAADIYRARPDAQINIRSNFWRLPPVCRHCQRRVPRNKQHHG